LEGEGSVMAKSKVVMLNPWEANFATSVRTFTKLISVCYLKTSGYCLVYSTTQNRKLVVLLLATKKRTKPFVESYLTEKADFSKLNILILTIPSYRI